jgi:glycosyltransferase involved in cell wall biosynthesis
MRRVSLASRLLECGALGRVSLIITTYNRPQMLVRAVESAQRAGRCVEVIVVDDASTDETPDICRTLHGIKYARAHPNHGVARAGNLGLLESTVDYIAFLDDDDIRLPASLDHQLALLEAEPSAGMIYDRDFFGDEECRQKIDFYPATCPQGDIFLELLRTNFIPCQSVLFRRDGLWRTGLLDEAAPGIDDWDLWVRIAELYPVLAIAEPVAIWRQPTLTSGQMSQRSEKLHRLARRLHREKWLQLPRALEAAASRRREIARSFAEYSAQQLIWEVVLRLKARRLRDFARVTAALLRMYPLVGIKLALGKPTRRFLAASLQRWRHKTTLKKT